MRRTKSGAPICTPDRTLDFPEAYNAISDETKKILRYWIEWSFKRSKRTLNYTSYGLKHDFEYDTGIYTTNGEFKGAMLAAGFRTPEPEALNWVFYVSYTTMAKKWKNEHQDERLNRREWLDRYYTNPTKEIITGPLVYFLQAGEAGPIKIGTAIDLNKRLAQLQTGCPQELRILGTLEGDHDLETELHKQFSKYRLRSEWFSPAPEVIDFIFQNATIHGFRERLQPYLREVVSLEKRALHVLAEAAKQQNSNGYDRIGMYYSLKSQLVKLVGWEGSNPKLKTQEHYDAAILFMSDLLPSDNVDLSIE